MPRPVSNKSRANRGMGLENMVTHTWAFYRKSGVGCGQKIPTPIQRNRRANPEDTGARYWHKKSTVDFLGHVYGVPVAFDCKSSGTGARLDLANITFHQELFLNDHERAGGVSFILIEFRTTGEFFAANLQWLKTKAAAAGRNSITRADCLAGAADKKSDKIIQIIRQPGDAAPVPFAFAVCRMAAATHGCKTQAGGEH